MPELGSKICVVIPVFNEAAAIGEVVRGVREKNLDVIVIDDGSEDASSQLAQDAGASIIKNDNRRGKGYSLQAGFNQALAGSYIGVIAMDGDGQHDPKDLEQFLHKIEVVPDSIVTGNRFEDAAGMPWLRYATNKVMSWIISAICKRRIPDTQCGYRYIGRVILEKIDIQSSDFEIETEVLIEAAKQGYNVYSVPVKTIYQDEESKIHPFRDTIRFVKYIWREVSGRK